MEDNGDDDGDADDDDVWGVAASQLNGPELATAGIGSKDLRMRCSRCSIAAIMIRIIVYTCRLLLEITSTV